MDIWEWYTLITNSGSPSLLLPCSLLCLASKLPRVSQACRMLCLAKCLRSLGNPPSKFSFKGLHWAGSGCLEKQKGRREQLDGVVLGARIWHSGPSVRLVGMGLCISSLERLQLGAAVHTQCPSTREVEARRSEVLGHPQLYHELQASLIHI